MANAGQGISEGGFLAVLWVLTGLATVLAIGRVLIRSILIKRFHLDDLFSFLAYVLLVTTMILATIANPLNYEVSAIIVGESPMPETSKFDDMVIRLRKWNVAGQMLFWTALYCVKLSFMFLYKYVLGSHRTFTRIWYAALVYIVCCYGICLIGVFGQCGNAHYLWTIQGCSTSYVAALDQKLIWVDYFFNVSSDLVGKTSGLSY
ncbi:hypothetical protein VP1G_11354 [Cytospora mali]|uniref:Rhodopsin domain-containing protein n=1 Tax=Cytospora mali TaxID=578113 RepID=A0A194VDI5_CYTMA|nr:hypothetical protein VP1G_11354 [Valsa mali var. pyri (nom. inval.)]